MAKEYAPFVRKIEVEVETMEMVKEAVEAGADIIMLDNMTPEMMKEAVSYINGRAETECSGNVTKENVARLVDIGVDYISSGALTHSAPILDISLKISMQFNRIKEVPASIANIYLTFIILKFVAKGGFNEL